MARERLADWLAGTGCDIGYPAVVLALKAYSQRRLI
jgi:hypothetical protein